MIIANHIHRLIGALTPPSFLRDIHSQFRNIDKCTSSDWYHHCGLSHWISVDKVKVYKMCANWRGLALVVFVTNPYKYLFIGIGFVEGEWNRPAVAPQPSEGNPFDRPNMAVSLDSPWKWSIDRSVFPLPPHFAVSTVHSPVSDSEIYSLQRMAPTSNRTCSWPFLGFIRNCPTVCVWFIFEFGRIADEKEVGGKRSRKWVVTSRKEVLFFFSDCQCGVVVFGGADPLFR